MSPSFRVEGGLRQEDKCNFSVNLTTQQDLLTKQNSKTKGVRIWICSALFFNSNCNADFHDYVLTVSDLSGLSKRFTCPGVFVLPWSRSGYCLCAVYSTFSLEPCWDPPTFHVQVKLSILWSPVEMMLPFQITVSVVFGKFLPS